MSAESFLITTDCAVCSRPFTVHRSRLAHGRGKHCSPACQYEARRRLPKLVMSFECVGCGSAFDRAPSFVNGRKGAGKYCTRACRDLHWVGQKNPNWQNGDKVYKRGPRWYSIRRRILARDKHQCVRCGGGGRLHVHHIVPFRMFEDADTANRDSNLVSLCPPCHRRIDARHKWVRLPQSGGVLMMAARGYAWELARSKGMI